MTHTAVGGALGTAAGYVMRRYSAHRPDASLLHTDKGWGLLTVDWSSGRARAVLHGAARGLVRRHWWT
jgi:hypothetical protein